jgi:hypothetical protein
VRDDYWANLGFAGELTQRASTASGERAREEYGLTQGTAFARLRAAAGSAETELNFVYRAEVAELADARGSGPRTRKGVGVRVPSSAPIHLKQMTYHHGGHCGVYKTAILVSIVASTSLRSFARVLRRMDNPPVPPIRRGARVNVFTKVRIRHGWRLCPVVRETNGRLRDRVRVGGCAEVHTEGVYYLEWREDGRRLRAAIPNAAEVLERARLKSMEFEARQTGVVLEALRPGCALSR